jgi:hypothetical protein
MTKARDIASAAPAPSTVSATEIGYLDGVSSAIQTQIDGKSGTSHNHDSTYVAKSLVDAKGDLLVGSANDTVSRLAVASTAGYVLTVDSAEATGLKWAAVSGGSYTVIASDNFPTNTNTLTLSSISSSYNDLRLVIRDFYFAGDDYLNMRFNSDTGTNYGIVALGHSAEDTATPWADGVRDRMFTTYENTNNADANNFALIQINDYANTNTFKVSHSLGLTRNGGDTFNSLSPMWLLYKSTSAISSITLFSQNTNNFSGGSYILYGVK